LECLFADSAYILSDCSVLTILISRPLHPLSSWANNHLINQNMTLKVFLPEQGRITIEVVIVIDRTDVIVLVKIIGSVVRGPASNQRASVARLRISEYVIR